jgi:hypothetical protein
MQDAYGILYSFDEGKYAKKKKNYLQAARCFRICRYFYEQGELSEYYPHVERRALKSYHWFDYCKSKLTDEAQNMLDKEEAEFCVNWRDFVHFNYQKIEEEKGMPSPNRPRKRKNFLKIIISYFNNMRKKL